MCVPALCLFLLLLSLCFHTKTDYYHQIYRVTRHFTLYNGIFPVCPRQRTGACKCHVIVVVLRLRVQKLTPAELRLFATQCGKNITMLFVYWFLWPLRLVWLLVCCLYKEVYLQIFKCVSFWLHGCCGEWEGGPVNQVNHTSWVAVVTLTDRPKSVRNCCLIELFCGVVCVVTLPFWHFCWCRGFRYRTGSDLLLFVSILFFLKLWRTLTGIGQSKKSTQTTPYIL